MVGDHAHTSPSRIEKRYDSFSDLFSFVFNLSCQADTEFIEQGRIQFHPDGWTRSTSDDHLPNTLDLRKFLRKD